MITPHLEHLIFEGKAFPKMYNLGAGGFLNIPVNPQEFFIITDVYCYGFADRRDQEPNDIFKRLVHTINFDSKESRDNITFRSDLKVGGAPGLSPTPTGFFHFQVYFIHSDLIKVSINTLPPPELWAITPGTPPAEAQQKAPPLGYGTTINSLRSVYLEGAANQSGYKPLNRLDNTAISDEREEFFANISPVTAIRPADFTNIENQCFTYPIVNIFGVIIRENIGSKIKGSR